MTANPAWRPDWRRLLAEAPEIPVPEGAGALYVVADAHLGDERSAPEPFLRMLSSLPEARMLVFLGDLFKVWLAPPKFWSAPVRDVIAGFRRVRDAGVPIVFVVGNREFLVPAEGAAARQMGLPFDRIVPGMATLRWGTRRYGLTHGDLVNRQDRAYLKWRRFSRGRLMSGLFRSLPGPVARGIASWLEASLARTNRPIKIRYPEEEVRAFAETVTPGLDGFLIGHFHLDITVPAARGRGFLRIVPDWFSRKAVLRLDPDGEMTVLDFPAGP
jgi:UDP-2,3-diacylglucosamine hydrolase